MGFQGKGTESQVPQLKAVRLHAEVTIFHVGVTAPHIKLMVPQTVVLQVGMMASWVMCWQPIRTGESPRLTEQCPRLR